eukprot:4455443-Pyramimonas_sp.AAC.1
MAECMSIGSLSSGLGAPRGTRIPASTRRLGKGFQHSHVLRSALTRFRHLSPHSCRCSRKAWRAAAAA